MKPQVPEPLAPTKIVQFLFWWWTPKFASSQLERKQRLSFKGLKSVNPKPCCVWLLSTVSRYKNNKILILYPHQLNVVFLFGCLHCTKLSHYSHQQRVCVCVRAGFLLETKRGRKIMAQVLYFMVIDDQQFSVCDVCKLLIFKHHGLLNPGGSASVLYSNDLSVFTVCVPASKWFWLLLNGIPIDTMEIFCRPSCKVDYLSAPLFSTQFLWTIYPQCDYSKKTKLSLLI